MDSEIEVKFAHIDKDVLKNTLLLLWWILDQPHMLMRRAIFRVDSDIPSRLRVRDEGTKITMTYKKVLDHSTIDGVKEIELTINSFDDGVLFLTSLWYDQKAYQESYREKRLLDGCEICIDERPWLDPFVEIEWPSQNIVEYVSKKLWLVRKDALFGPVNTLYVKFLGCDSDELNTIDITFDQPLVSKL